MVVSYGLLATPYAMGVPQGFLSSGLITGTIVEVEALPTWDITILNARLVASPKTPKIFHGGDWYGILGFETGV